VKFAKTYHDTSMRVMLSNIALINSMNGHAWIHDRRGKSAEHPNASEQFGSSIFWSLSDHDVRDEHLFSSLSGLLS
jgi:hypothetical protein